MAKNNWVKEYSEDGMIRIDWMIPLSAQSPTRLLQDSVEEMSWEVLKEVFDSGGYVKELFYDGNYRDICEWILENKYGKFLCYVTTPVMGEGNMFSWGHTYCGYLLADSFEDAAEKSIKWRNKIIKTVKSKKKKK